MGKRNMIFVIPVVFLLAVFLATNLFSAQIDTDTQSLKPSTPQSTIQNLSSTSTGDPKFEKSEVVQKTKKLQMPFIANNGQADGRVAFYANTFGGTVFVTKDGEIVYALPNNSSDVETQCLTSLIHSPNRIRDEVSMLHDYHVSDIVHPASCIMDLG